MKYRDILRDAFNYFAKNTMDYIRGKSSKTTEHVFQQIFGGDETKLNDPYRQLPIVRRAVRTRAQNIAQVPFRIFKGNATEPATIGDPMVNLFESINPWTNKFQFWELNVTYMDLYGDAPVWPTDDLTRGVPSALINIRPSELIELVDKDTKMLEGWEWRPANKKFEEDEIILPKYTNPYNRFRGLSIIGAASSQLDSEWGAIRYNQVFYDNGQAPGSVFSTQEVLDDTAFLRLKNELTRDKGVNNSHKSMLLDGGVKLSNVRPSNRDMEFLNQRNFTREEIGPVLFSVPMHILGLDKDVNRNTAKEQEIGFWKNVLIPLMRNLQEAFNHTFLMEYGYQGMFDITAIDALNNELLIKAESAKTFHDMGVPMNELNRRLNLGFDEDSIPNGDLANWQISSSMQDTTTRQLEKGELPGTDIDLKALIKAKRLAQWKQLDNTVTPLMAKTAREVKEYFFQIEKKLLKKLNGLLKAYKREPTEKTVGSEMVMNLDEFFDDVILIGLLTTGIVEALDSGALTIANFGLPDTSISAYIQQRGTLITGINATARDLTLKKLTETLNIITDQGLSEAKAAELLRAALKDSFKITKARARTIARTEIGTAFTEARTQKAVELGAKEKEWLDSQDNRVRPTHQIHTEKQAINDTFSNGLLYPREPGAPADEVINCRCEVLYLFPDGSEK